MSEKFESINDLIENKPVEEAPEENNGGLRIINDLTEIAPSAGDVEIEEQIKAKNEWFEDFDKAIDDSINETNRMINESLQEFKEKEDLANDEKEIESELGDSEDIEDVDLFENDDLFNDEPKERNVTHRFIKKESKRDDDMSIFDDIEDDFKFEDDVEEENKNTEKEEINKENFKEFQEDIKENVKIVNRPIDISSFKFSKKHVSANKSIDYSAKNEFAIDWILRSGKKFSMKEWKGFEITMLSVDSHQGETLFKAYHDIYKLIYNHIIDDDKPPFEAWIKSLKYKDNEDLYFGIYKACFSGANSIPYSCSNNKCENIFMQEVPIEDMVVYKNDEVKQRVKEILNGTNTIDGTDEVDVIMISDDYAVGIKEPSIYDVVFEPVLLAEDKFADKYADVLGLIVYFDEVYYIDRKNEELVPIDISIKDPHNRTKAFKNKVLQYSKIIRTLTSDQYDNLISYINNIETQNTDIQYRLPETTCPKCGSKINEQINGAEVILFTRRQLLHLANSSIN